ncbi:MAG: discoidin domain-containing protein, partial [Bacteroidota bacterium]
MKRKLIFRKSLPLPIFKPLLSPLLGLIALSTLAFIPLLIAPPGLTNPEPVRAYLNGKFPKSIGGDVDLVPAYPNLMFDSPLTWAVHPHDNKVFVGQRDGKVYYFEDEENAQTKELFIDMSDRVGVVWDGGFLGFAFHPNFGKAGANGRNYFFSYYSTKDQTGANSSPTPQRCPEDALYDGAFLVLQRFEVFEGTLTVDETKTIDMFKVRLYNSTHRGGGLIFGKDGLLYLTTGDQAQHSTAQELSTNLDGGILRFDVDMDPTRSHPPTYVMPKDFPRAPDETSGNGYYIPNDNPYVGWANTFEEYYAIGLRNPHRMTMDRLTGNMYIGDIGAGTHEEINVVGKAKNYGWPVWEGPVRKNTCTSELYNDNSHQLPLTAFPRSNANSIIGGYVYRGTQIPDLSGTYICGDWGSGREVWTIDTTSGEFTQISAAPAPIISFGEGKDGELYVLTQGSDRQLLRMESSGTPNDLPQTLSETGAFTNLTNLSPAQGLIPYEMYESFWSDNAEKKRWLIVPNDGSYDSPDEQITYSENDIWRFPEGTMFIKHFELPVDERNLSITRRLETRFTIVGKDKKVYGVTYKWRADGSDADLVAAEGLDEAINIRTQSGETRTQVWHYPGRSECLTCHTEAMGGTLGPRTRYLNIDYTYPSTGTTANQLVTLSHLGVLDAAITDAEVDALPRNSTQDDPFSSLQTRARSYLDLNCSYCHQPFTGNRAVFDSRISTPLHLSNLFSSRLNESLGIEGEQVIAPGDTGRSVLYKRIHSVLPAVMMPPLAKSLIDQEGADLIAEWIQSMDPNLEVEECISNLALNKPTRQSSTGYSGVSARAVDGNRNGVYGGASVTHTNNENQPWWEVDLEASQLVTNILLYNRTDCCTNRLTDFYVLTSETPFTSDDLTTILNQPGVSTQFYGGSAGAETILSVNQTARYIRIQLQNRGILSLAEVELTSCPQEPLQMDCRNIALGKEASQSSMYTSRLSFEASNAVDGNTLGFDLDNSMTHTLFEQNAWWEVDLAESYPLTGIKLWNRDAANCCEDRLSDFYVISSNVPFTSQDLNTTLAQEGVDWIHYKGTAGRETFLTWENEARYIRVQLAGTNALSLAEVEIYTECYDQPRRDCEQENYALGKPASQSSNWNTVFTADKGVDGDTDGFDENGTMTHTLSEFQPWWEVDLEELKEVDQIHFWNRDMQDCSCYDRLTDFYVISSPVPFTSQALSETLEQPEVTWVRHKGTASSKTILDWNQQARYVRFQLNGNNPLTLAEVAVMGCKDIAIPDTEAPSIPQNIVASDITETGLKLNWSASTDNEGVQGYYVYQDGNATPVGTVSNLFFNVLGLEPGSTHLFAVAAFDSAGNVSAQSQAIEVTTLPIEPELPTNFFAHWPLDDDTNDAIGDADGVLQGGASLIGDEQRGKVLSIANNGEHVLVAPKPQLQVGKEGQDFSVAFWMKLTQDKTGAWRSVMHKGEENYQRTFAMWMRPSDNRLHYRISTDASANEGADSQSELPLNEWTHIAYVKEGQSLRLYLNGVVDHQVALRGTTLSNVGNLYFGDTPWYVPAQGMMDDIRLYGYAISPDEISDLMLAPACQHFETLAGAGLDIGSGGGVTYAIGNNNYVYKWDECTKSWEVFSTTPLASRIDVDVDGNPWIIATDQKIYRWNGTAFQQLPGAAVEIGISGNTVFVANAAGNLYQFNGSSWNGLSRPDFVSRVDVRNGQPWVITQTSEVYQYAGSNWLKKGDFQAKDISISDKDSSIFVLSQLGEVYTYTGNGVYTRIGASNGENLTVGNEGNIWVLQSDRTILRKRDCESLLGEDPCNGSSACETPQNLALGRTARQSSTYGNGVAALAVDGNLIGTSPWSADLQHTNNESQPWWEVDLAARSKIDSIRIYNRSDCCEERLKDFYVLVSD